MPDMNENSNKREEYNKPEIEEGDHLFTEVYSAEQLMYLDDFMDNDTNQALVEKITDVVPSSKEQSYAVRMGVNRPKITSRKDVEAVNKKEKKYEFVLNKVSGEQRKAIEKRMKFTKAFEKSLIFLANAKDLNFFGERITLARASKYDDYENGTDLLAKIDVGEDAEPVYLSLDATTATWEKNLHRKMHGLHYVRYLPQMLSDDETRDYVPGQKAVASRLVFGLPPSNAIPLVGVANDALEYDRLQNKNSLSKEETVGLEKIENRLKRSTFRIVFAKQMIIQAERAIAVFKETISDPGFRNDDLMNHGGSLTEGYNFRIKKIEHVVDYFQQVIEDAENDGAKFDESVKDGGFHSFLENGYKKE